MDIDYGLRLNTQEQTLQQTYGLRGLGTYGALYTYISGLCGLHGLYMI